MKMAAQSGGRLAKKNPSQIHHGALSDIKTRQAIKTLMWLIQSTVGPRGKISLVHNGIGGHVTATSSASRIIPVLSQSEPAVQMILSSIQGHIATYKDGGLFALLMTLTLVDSSLDLDIHKRLLIEIYNKVQEQCMEFLETGFCKCVDKVEFSQIDQLLHIAQSVLKSKVGCCWTPKSLNHTSRLVVESFLKSVTDCATSIKYEEPLITCVEGREITDSKVMEGILYETPHIPTFKRKHLEIKHTIDMKGSSNIKVAVFVTSLAGDSPEITQAKYEIFDSKSSFVDELVTGGLYDVVTAMTKEGVGVVASQKVVQPQVKRLWEKQGVLVLDRMGRNVADALCKLTGAIPISSTSAAGIDPSSFGWLTAVNHKVMEGRSYVHLTNDAAPVYSLLLCNIAEESLEELKCACISAHHVLQMALYKPQVLVGAGFWQEELAGHITRWVKQNEKMIGKELSCSPHQVRTAGQNFAQSLVSLAKAITKRDLRLPSKRFSCDDIPHTRSKLKNELPVFDSYTAFISAFSLAVATANMILSVHTVIKGSN